jgi:hypothetical protein
LLIKGKTNCHKHACLQSGFDKLLSFAFVLLVQGLVDKSKAVRLRLCARKRRKSTAFIAPSNEFASDAHLTFVKPELTPVT